jgi:undecaprenyl-diphosphatase
MARRLLTLVTAYAVLALVVIGWGWLLTHPLEGPIDGTDDDMSRWFAGQRTSSLDPVADAGTLLGETPVGVAIGAVVAAVAGLAFRSIGAVLLVLLALAGNGGIYWLGTHAAPRDRPPVRLLDAGLVPDHSFPSGHVGTAVAVYGGAAVLLMLWVRGRERGSSRVVVALLVCVPVFVAVSRLYQGVHHVTDVGTSLVYGTVWLAVLAALLRPQPPRAEPAVPRSTGGHADAPVPHRRP